MPPEDNTAWIDSLVENNDEVDERFATKVIIEYYYVLNKSGSQHMGFVFCLKKMSEVVRQIVSTLLSFDSSNVKFRKFCILSQILRF